MGAAPVSASAPPAPTHSEAFRARRFRNWFPLGITYATFYMGRYNLNVVKGELGRLYGLDKTQLGFIATAGFWTYALAVIFNGPLADRFGGKRAILLGALGAALLNLTLGLLFLARWQTHVLVGMSLLWAMNNYFQSFGALSVVKVNSAWFHVRERGIFGGIFGVMISSGYALALGLGGFIVAQLPWYWVFLIPAGAILAMFVVDLYVVRDTPGEAGHPDFDTGDASSGDEAPVDLSYLARKVLGNPVIVTIALAEFCTGFVRQGLVFWFTDFLREVHGIQPGTSLHGWASAGITLGGIAGGLLCGWMSDRLFGSRRAPVAFIFYLCQIGSLLALGLTSNRTVAVFLIGFSCMWIFGVHGMLSGTASADFGGRKAAASATGLLDGIQYLASGLTGFGLGYLLQHHGWRIWTWSIIPFSVVGALLMTRLWNARPAPRPPPTGAADSRPRLAPTGS